MTDQTPRDTLEAYLRIRDLRMIVLSSVVHRVMQYRINNPGQYPYPTNYDSYYNVNHDHAPTNSPDEPEFIDDMNTLRDEEMYKDLKTRTSKEEDQVGGNICVVCQDDLYEKENDDETIATLNCGHEYHLHCIASWLRRKNVCPLCNAAALP